MSDAMNRAMSHDEAFEQVGALALGALDGAEAQAVMQHVESCGACQQGLKEMHEVVTRMPASSTLGSMPPETSHAIRSSLLDRASNTRSTARPSTNSWRVFSVAATIALAVLGAAYYRERALTASLLSTVASRVALVDSLTGVVRQKDDQLAGITGPGVRVVELTSSAIQAPSARMFWDRATNKWTMYAHGLSQLEPGRAYELWLVTADTKIPAGTFKPASDGTAVFSATYALQPSDLKAIAITEEPEAGVPAPTGPIILLGAPTA